ncbi:hypothetical protein Indivirus_5_24 [Indivirus ILV1]|uniref:Uncharacterized protein n=1 Tax=Indivirus ILV1 TaxID=1977633 RepID=A0A1V0SDY1_9VIRU|nr:hypothetical protein Indivirus_5_24 [Indivirus ILV1]
MNKIALVKYEYKYLKYKYKYLSYKKHQSGGNINGLIDGTDTSDIVITDNEIWYYAIGGHCDDVHPEDTPAIKEEKELCLFQQIPTFLRNIDTYKVNIVLIDELFSGSETQNTNYKNNFKTILDGNIETQHNNYFKIKNYNIYIIKSKFEFTLKFKDHILEVERKGGINIMVNFVKFRLSNDFNAPKFDPYFDNLIINKNSEILKFFLDDNVKNTRLLLEWLGYSSERGTNEKALTGHYMKRSAIYEWSQYLVNYANILGMKVLNASVALNRDLSPGKSINELTKKLATERNFFVIPFTNKKFSNDDGISHFNEVAIKYIKIIKDADKLIIIN